MKSNRKRALKIASIVAGTTGVTAVTTFLTTNYMLKLAINREMPKSIKGAGNRISGKKTDSDFLQEIKTSAQKLVEHESEEITIAAYDGIELVGHFIPADDPDRIIIAMHGWRSSWYRDFGMVSETWHDNNCSVLYVEQRGQNNSGGDYMGFGLTERYDCAKWVDWIIEKFGSTLPIYLAGVSMGATTVLLATGLNLPPEVHGVIADCGFTSADAIWKHIAVDNLHMLYGMKGIIADELFQKKTKESSNQYSTEDALRNTDIPILFIHGSDDHFVPVSMTYDNYKACAGPKDILIIPGADHAMSYYISPKKYEDTVLGFWREYDTYDRKRGIDG